MYWIPSSSMCPRPLDASFAISSSIRAATAGGIFIVANYRPNQDRRATKGCRIKLARGVRASSDRTPLPNPLPAFAGRGDRIDRTLPRRLSQSTWVDLIGVSAAVLQGSAGHQRVTGGGGSGSMLSPGLGVTIVAPAAAPAATRAFDRLGPAVRGELEQPPVHRQHHLAAQHPVGDQRLFGADVPVGPGAVVLPDLDHRHVERAQARADLAHGRVQAGVAREEDAVARADERVARPQLRVRDRTACCARRRGARACRRSPARRRAFDPTSRARRCAPRARPSTPGAPRCPAARRTSSSASPSSRRWSACPGGRSDRARSRPRRWAADRRSAIGGRYQRCGPIQVSGEARSLQTGSVSTRVAVDLDQRVGVPEPGHAQAGRRRRGEAGGIDRRRGNRLPRAAVRAGVEHRRHRAPVVIVERLRIHEVAVLPLRRPLHARPPRADRPMPHRGPGVGEDRAEPDQDDERQPARRPQHAAPPGTRAGRRARGSRHGRTIADSGLRRHETSAGPLSLTLSPLRGARGSDRTPAPARFRRD